MTIRHFGKWIFGFVSFTIGVAILLWCVYNLVVPNPHFQFRLIDLPRLLLPVAFIWVGWSAMRGAPAAATPHAAELLLTLQLSGDDLGTEPERDRVLDLKHRLERVLSETHLGEIDGEEFGDGKCLLFVQTNTPVKAAKTIRQFLAAEGAFRYTLSNTT